MSKLCNACSRPFNVMGIAYGQLVCKAIVKRWKCLLAFIGIYHMLGCTVFITVTEQRFKGQAGRERARGQDFGFGGAVRC